VSPSSDIVSPSSDIVSPSSDIVSPSSDIVSPSSDIVSPSEADFGGFSPSYIYIYNNNKEDKKIEKNIKYNLAAEPSGDDCETLLDVGTTDSGEEDPDAREALARWTAHPCLAQWHYCDAWAEEYLRMREAFPSREALLEAIDRFGGYHDIKGRNGDGFGNNTMHFLRSAQSWTSDEAAAVTIREHQDRFWTRRKRRSGKHRSASDARTGSHPARDPEPDTELIPAAEMIPAAEAEPDPEHRAECLAFLRGALADDDYARWRFDERHETGLRLYVRRPITITQCGPEPIMALAAN